MLVSDCKGWLAFRPTGAVKDKQKSRADWPEREANCRITRPGARLLEARRRRRSDSRPERKFPLAFIFAQGTLMPPRNLDAAHERVKGEDIAEDDD